MTEIEIEPNALDSYASAVDDRATILAELKGQMNAIHVSRASFGYIPGIGDRVFTAYDEFANNLRDSLWAATYSMNEIADTVRHVADQYRTADRDTADYVGSIDDGLSAVEIPRYR